MSFDCAKNSIFSVSIFDICVQSWRFPYSHTTVHTYASAHAQTHTRATLAWRLPTFEREKNNHNTVACGLFAVHLSMGKTKATKRRSQKQFTFRKIIIINCCASENRRKAWISPQNRVVWSAAATSVYRFSGVFAVQLIACKMSEKLIINKLHELVAKSAAAVWLHKYGFRREYPLFRTQKKCL